MYTIVNLLTVTNTVPAVLKKIWSIYCDKELLCVSQYYFTV